MSTGADIKLPAPPETRLVTIVAHVDHGKTSLADNLITANGIINEKMSGSLRYLDSTEEERRRGITMHASAIGLRHEYKEKLMVVHLIDSPGHVDFCQEVTSSLMACDGAIVVIDAVEGLGARSHAVLRESYSNELVPILVINKVDRLCTELHLSKVEAYVKLRILLESINAACASIINAHVSDENMDGTAKDFISTREYHEFWDFDPAKGNVIFASALHNWAFSIPHLARSLFKSGVLPLKPIALRKFLFGDYKYNSDKNKIFAWKPQNDDNSVLPIFAEFALAPIWDIYNGIEDYTVSFNSSLSSSDVDSTKQNRKLNITESTPGVASILQALKCGCVSLPDYRIRSFDELQNIINSNSVSKSCEGLQRAILRRFRTLSDTVMDSICENLPDPILATRKKSLGLKLNVDHPALSFDQREHYDEIKRSIQACVPSKLTITIAYVFKFVAVARNDLSHHTIISDFIEADSPTVLLGLTRVLSGVLKSADVEYFLFGPSSSSDKVQTSTTIDKKRVQLFLIMGSSFVAVKEVPAGHICAVSNLDDLRWRTLTLCNTEFGIPIRGLSLNSKPLVKVNVSTTTPSDTDILERGLVKLSLADASVDITMTKRGELLLATLGELHLENSLRDLLHIYCDKPIDIRTSDPIIEFGEGTSFFDFEEKGIEGMRKAWNSVPPLRQVTISPYCDEDGIENAKLGRCRSVLGGKVASISVRVVPLSKKIFQCLKTLKQDLTEEMTKEIVLLGRVLGILSESGNEFNASALLHFVASLTKAVDDTGGNVLIEAPEVADGKNIFPVVGEAVYSQPKDENEKPSNNIHNHQQKDDTTIENIPLSVYNSVMRNILHDKAADKGSGKMIFYDNEAICETMDIWKSRMIGSSIAGFHAAMRAGPLCEEPIRNVLVVIEAVEIAVLKKEGNQAPTDRKMIYGPSKPIGGGVILSAIRQGIRCAFLTRPARLIEGYFKLSLHSSLEGLGPLYHILSKRRGRVENDTMVDGTDLLLIEALLPQAEAFGLTQELLLKSSGNVTAPEMVFSHYEMLDEDPFWIPLSLEEREDYGEIVASGDSSTGVVKHRALTYLRNTRRRKGLGVDEEKILKDGEKQRTLARKK